MPVRPPLPLLLLLLGAAGCTGTQADTPSPDDLERDATSLDAVPAANLALVEQTRDHGFAKVIVELDLALEPEGHLTPEETRRQRATLAAAQDRVIAGLPQGSIDGVKRFVTAPGFAARLTEEGLRRLPQVAGVARVRADGLGQPTLGVTVPLVGATNVHNAQGITGVGQTIAVLDTGTDFTHPTFGGRVVDGACFSENWWPVATGLCPNGQNTQTGSLQAGQDSPSHVGNFFHGTYVASIAMGQQSAGGFQNGVAPAANLLSVNVFHENNVTGDASVWESDVILGLEYVANQTSSFDIAAVNLSLSLGVFNYESACSDTVFEACLDNLASHGVVTIGASGNDAEDDEIAYPACLPQVVAVGASMPPDASGTEQIRPDSNSAPPLDMFAPGTLVGATVPNASSPVQFSGTSAAAPHVAGAVAVLRDRHPDASVAQIRTALTTNGPMLTDAKTVGVWGATEIRRRRLDVSAAATDLASTLEDGHRADPDLAARDDGEHYVVWEDDRDQDGAVDILIQRYDASGTAVSGRVVVNEAAAGHHEKPAVAVDSLSGHVVVVWRERTTGFQISARMFEPTLTPLGSQFRVDQTASVDVQDPDVAFKPGAGWYATWSVVRNTIGGQDADVMVRGFDSDGDALSNEAVASESRADTQLAPAIDFAEGGAIVVWEDFVGFDFHQSDVRGRFLDTDGNPTAQEFLCNRFPQGRQSAPAVAMGDATEAVVTWEDDWDSDGHLEVYAQRIDQAGGFFGNELNVATTGTLGGTDDWVLPAVALSGSEFVIAWQTDSASAGSSVNYRSFVNASSVGGVQTAPLVFDEAVRPTVGITGGGSPILAWEEYQADLTNRARVRASVSPSASYEVGL